MISAIAEMDGWRGRCVACDRPTRGRARLHWNNRECVALYERTWDHLARGQSILRPVVRSFRVLHSSRLVIGVVLTCGHKVIASKRFTWRGQRRVRCPECSRA